MVNKTLKFSILAFLGTIGIFLVALGLDSYPGSKFVYLLFSTVFWLMLLTSFGKQTHYGYLFLAIMLWLGFWGKLTVHLILDYSYVEPVGLFDNSASSWDKVLWVATFASIGLMIGKLLFISTGAKFSRATVPNQENVPIWFLMNRRQIWAISLVIIIGIHILNVVLGIHQIGLVPRTILPWPLNALIGIHVSIGSAMWITVLMWWDLSLKKTATLSIFVLLIEAMISTVSLLSRGVYVFHTAPQIFALFENRTHMIGISRTKTLTFVLVFIGLMIFSISAVTTLRSYMYPHSASGHTSEVQAQLTRLEVLVGGIANVKRLISEGEPLEEHLREILAEKELLKQSLFKKNESFKKNITKKELVKEKKDNKKAGESKEYNSSLEGELFDEFEVQLKTGTFLQIAKLSIDRWVGLEGLMAVSAYPSISYDLFFDAINERRELGKTTKFQEISDSHYQWTDNTTWQFASLPGITAFLYLSGSLLIVLLGMTLVSFLLQAAEQSIFYLLSNPLLSSLVGFTMANSISQFGITPRQDLPFYSMILAFLLVVYLLQSDAFNKIWLKACWSRR